MGLLPVINESSVTAKKAVKKKVKEEVKKTKEVETIEEKKDA
jgi:Fe-S cluster biogenesis protein NfuA